MRKCKRTRFRIIDQRGSHAHALRYDDKGTLAWFRIDPTTLVETGVKAPALRLWKDFASFREAQIGGDFWKELKKPKE